VHAASPRAVSGPRGLLALAALLFAALAGAWPAAAADDDPRTWVDRMNRALAENNYDGVFVHQIGGNRETLRIIHRVRDGRMTERLVSTDGSGREFIRDGSELVAYFPDRRMVVVEKRPRNVGFLGRLPGLDSAIRETYEVRDVERKRMQGRWVRVITVTPRDGFRYGYRLWIDEDTAMPVRTQLASLAGDVIEQISFASLTFPAVIDDEMLRPEVATEGFKWLRRDQPGERDAIQVPWTARPDQLPPGFRRSRHDEARDGTAPRPSSHLVFTDGLAMVSVFIEKASLPPQLSRDGTPRKANGHAQLGAAAAFTALTDGHRVTAVGEVPPATVKAIAEALRPMGAADSADRSRGP
jgi:sigma-E factor negative regulatory protein RseB